ncbi:MAG: histidine phosphatase family protein [Clostridia bacterium]|nr:histidine phosphatase family protein [Clostridia bacterium]
MMTKIILIRHGESEANQLSTLAGFSDYQLTDLGLKQAQLTAEHLKNEKIDVIYSSDLRRAMRTAIPHAEQRGLSVITCPELRETFCGDWEGGVLADLRAKYPVEYARMRETLDFTYPGGENWWDSGVRFYKKALEIAKENPDRTVLIVAHGGVIRVFWSLVCGTPKEQAAQKHPYATNASYSIVNFDGERFIPIEYSIDSHLPEVTHFTI